VELASKESRHHRKLAEARYQLNDWRGAAESLEKAIALGQAVGVQIGFQLAICNKHLDRQEHAVKWFEQGVALMEQEQRQQAGRLLGITAPQTVESPSDQTECSPAGTFSRADGLRARSDGIFTVYRRPGQIRSTNS